MFFVQESADRLNEENIEVSAMGMNVFIDTNILLKFFHFTKDQLDELTNVFASHAHGAAKVHLTRQVCDEFKRNRETKIKDALNKFKGGMVEPQLPSFMRSFPEFDRIQRLSELLQKEVKNIRKKADKAIAENALEADALIADIFSRAQIIETDDDVYQHVQMRVAIGNPPGKSGSIGDAINWTILLANVPDHEDLHIISEDGDFFSLLNPKAVNPFLADEWKTLKYSTVHVYSSLSDFMTKHFDGVAFSYDQDKELMIDALGDSGSFAETHQIIEKLTAYEYFSLREVQRVLDAAVSNSQVGHIVTDSDVLEFLNRIAVPRMGSITVPEQVTLLGIVMDEKKRIESGA